MNSRYFLVCLFIFWQSYSHSLENYYPFMFIFPAVLFHFSQDNCDIPENIKAFAAISIGFGTLLTGISHVAIAYCKHSEKSSDEQAD